MEAIDPMQDARNQGDTAQTHRSQAHRPQAYQPRAYQQGEASPDIPEIESRILRYWRDDGTFRASVERRDRLRDGESNEYVFYDGPPFANGLPHYGHLATGFVKDLMPRYQTMRGKRVERRFGWDCHGLPAELESERELGISGRREILELGIGEFNAHCRKSVLRFTDQWREYVTRQGRWVDFEHSYKTMDLSFMESVIWGFKTLYDNGLVYRDHRVVPYSWAVQTPLSNFETRLDNAYRERQDPALTVRFRLDGTLGNGPSGDVPTSLLAWTTMPWTLPSNLALAVGADIPYAVLEGNGERVVLAQAACGRYARELAEWTQVATLPGAALVGRTYAPMFPYFTDRAGGFRILPGEFVATDQGTGIVHLAPGFGEDDLTLARRHGLAPVVPVDEGGRFTSDVPDYEGLNVFDANRPIIRDLKRRGAVLRHETCRHSYPHCWRTDKPLIYKAIDAWYVRVSAFRDRMVALNREIRWVPGHVRDGLFGNWLENARDWNVSRNRFWGCPIPIWESDDPAHPRIDVYGSLDEIERDFGRRPEDLHRPHIDAFVRPNPDDPSGKSMMRRTPEVFDAWFESGSMPHAQLHYPFENKDRFERNFPADFIVEYVAQTRGWFYTLMVLSTALFDKAPFKTCVCHGVVLDESKRKLSKRLDNYPDPKRILARYGADALRVHMLSSPLLNGGDLQIDRDGRGVRDALRAVVMPIWNTLCFFTLYANAEGYRARHAPESEDPHDRYILAKTRAVTRAIEGRLDAADIPGAYGLLPPFIDVLNNWYVRRNRQRFWQPSIENGRCAAFDTLYTVLTTVCKAIAPLLPFLSEHIARTLMDVRSVHLCDWPDVRAFPTGQAIVEAMDLARGVCAAGMAIRDRNRLRVRQPLRRVTVFHPGAAAIEPLAETIRDALNLKTVAFSDDLSARGDRRLRVDPRVGRRIGGRLKAVLSAAAAGAWTRTEAGVSVDGIALEPGEYEIRIEAPAAHDVHPFDGGAGSVLVDLSLDDALIAEAWARDFVRCVQQTRKTLRLDVGDRIAVRAVAAPRVGAAIERHRRYIEGETLADEIVIADPGNGPGDGKEDGPGYGKEGGADAKDREARFRIDGTPVSVSVSVRRPAAAPPNPPAETPGGGRPAAAPG